MRVFGSRASLLFHICEHRNGCCLPLPIFLSARFRTCAGAGNFAIWGGGSYTVNKKTSLNAQVSYTDAKDFAVAANVAYTIVPGYTVTAEVDYFNNSDIADSSAVGGIVRFQRSF